MTVSASSDHFELATRIAQLVQSRGWNLEEFARAARLNRQTARQILNPRPGRCVRRATVARCAQALQLSPHDLASLPIDELLKAPKKSTHSTKSVASAQLYEFATQPELLAWAERNRERAEQLTPDELDELLSLQGVGGPLTPIGVERFVEVIERKRELIRKVHAIAGTEFLPLLEQIVQLLYEKIQTYRDRK